MAAARSAPGHDLLMLVRRPTPWSCSSRRGPTHSFPFPSARTRGSSIASGKTSRPAAPCAQSRPAAADAMEAVHQMHNEVELSVPRHGQERKFLEFMWIPFQCQDHACLVPMNPLPVCAISSFNLLESSFCTISRPVLHAAARVVQEMGKSRSTAYYFGAYDEGGNLQAYSNNV